MINIEVCNVANIANITDVKIKLEKNKVILQGTNYYKHYDVPKGVNMKFDNNCLTAQFEEELLRTKLNNQSRNNKFFTIIKDSIEHNKTKNNNQMWISHIENSKNLNGLEELNKYEKNIKYKSHTVYTSEFMGINNNYCLQNDNGNIFLRKKTDSEEHMKINGGIIFDHENNFIQHFNDGLKNIKNSRLKNFLISDILPRQQTDLNFTFKHIKNIKQSLKLDHVRLIVYYPTKEMLSQLIKFIGNKLEKPRIVWLVFPGKASSNNLEYRFQNFLNFNEVLNILFWSNTLLKTFNPSIISLKFAENRQIPKKQNQVIIEKIKYNLSQNELDLLSDVNYKNINMLDKLYFYNLGEALPRLIYNCTECPICCERFNPNNITYMPCGHMFCSRCLVETIKIKNCCPNCRKNTKLNGIIIPSLVSTKMKLLLEIIKKIENDFLTIIYTDTFTISKKLLVYLNNLENIKGENNICNILNQKSSTSQRKNEKILICPIENDFLCQNIKNIKNVVMLTTNSDYSLKSESLGYDYHFGNSDVKLWLFECII